MLTSIGAVFSLIYGKLKGSVTHRNLLNPHRCDPDSMKESGRKKKLVELRHVITTCKLSEISYIYLTSTQLVKIQMKPINKTDKGNCPLSGGCMMQVTNSQDAIVAEMR